MWVVSCGTTCRNAVKDDIGIYISIFYRMHKIRD